MPFAILESPLPRALPSGTRTALFCMGRTDAAELSLRAGADAVPAHVARGRFWGVVPCHVAGEVKIEAIANGEPLTLASIDATAARPALDGRASDPELVAVCMATFNPDPQLLQTQLVSLRAQTDERWTCVISDDHSDPERYAAIAAMVDGDPRFALSRAEARIGFYRNFERALALAPPAAGLIALCDQDDVWHADKLARLRAGLGEATLVYSDMRLVDRDGRLLGETLWRGRANNHTNLASMLVANTVTGAAALMRREVVERALPFPDSPGVEFHDHWLALIAMGLGELAYVDAPLYDYVQHRQAILGKVAGESRRRVRTPARNSYFLGYVPGQVRARTLIERCGERVSRRRRAELERFLSADRSAPALLWLALRPLRALLGRTETLGAEWDLVPGLIWVRLARWLDPGFPDPPVFEHRRLRRWRTLARRWR